MDYWYILMLFGVKWIIWWVYLLGFGGVNLKDCYILLVCLFDLYYWKGVVKGCMNRVICIIKEMIVWCLF